MGNPFMDWIVSQSPRAAALGPTMNSLLRQMTATGGGHGIQDFATQVAGLSRGTAIMAGAADPLRGMYAKQNVGAELMQSQGIGSGQLSGMMNNVLRQAGMPSQMISQMTNPFAQTTHLPPPPKVTGPGFYSPTPWSRPSYFTGFSNPYPIWFHR